MVQPKPNNSHSYDECHDIQLENIKTIENVFHKHKECMVNKRLKFDFYASSRAPTNTMVQFNLNILTKVYTSLLF